MSLAIQFKASNSYSLFHTEVLISWTFLGLIEPYKEVLRTSSGGKNLKKSCLKL